MKLFRSIRGKSRWGGANSDAWNGRTGWDSSSRGRDSRQMLTVMPLTVGPGGISALDVVALGKRI